MRGLQVNVAGGAPGVVGGKKHTTLEHEVDLQVNVAGGAPGVVGGKKHTTLEHEVVCPW
jgi:hypothetical protein